MYANEEIKRIIIMLLQNVASYFRITLDFVERFPVMTGINLGPNVFWKKSNPNDYKILL